MIFLIVFNNKIYPKILHFNKSIFPLFLNIFCFVQINNIHTKLNQSIIPIKKYKRQY